jgi:hypothetical protein
MKKVLLLSALLVGFSIPTTIQPTLAIKSQCLRAINTAKKQLGGAPQIQGTKNFLLESFYGQHPVDRPRGVSFTLKTDKFMANTQLQTEISRNITNKCSNISLVRFGENQTDWVNIYGLVNGRIKKFTCKEAGESIKWGEQVCL